MSMTAQAFSGYTDFLQTILARRNDIIVAIERILNCQKKPLEYQQDIHLQSQRLMECFFALPELSHEQSALLDQLEKARWSDGLKPRNNPGNDIIDPVQMLLRAFHLWQQTRWPGQKGRQRYAHTLYNLYLIRNLALLTLRLWDEGPKSVGTRLSQLQVLLDKLWQDSPNDQPQLVLDIRWLIPVALSPTTDDLSGYFKFATRIAETFSEQDQIETQRAWVQTGAGHLNSQLRHMSVQRAVPIDEPELVLITRKSNALDVCLLMEGLVTLFKAYEQACLNNHVQQRQSLAAAICHSVSPDPELFLLRLDLLAPYTMLEHLFIVSGDDGQPKYTAAGIRNLALLNEYERLLERLTQPLLEDSLQCKPVEGGYSPYGTLYGFSSNLLELMAFKTLQAGPVGPFSMEDIFTEGTADKRAWVNEWRKLPHIKPEVTKQFEYPEDFAQLLHSRVEQALQRRVSRAENKATKKYGRLFILSDSGARADTALAQLPELPVRYIVSSDVQEVEAHRAKFQEEEDLLHCRLEGEFLVSYKTAQGWMAITKDMLTEVLVAGNDVKITGLPNEAAQVLSLMCPNLTVLKKAKTTLFLNGC